MTRNPRRASPRWTKAPTPRAPGDGLEARLAAHYRAARPASGADARDGLARAMASEARRACRGETVPQAALSFVGFVAAQARLIRPAVWLAHLALVALAALVCASAPDEPGTACAVAVLGAAAVLVEAPALLASKASGVAELEFACRFDHRSVLAARMVVLGCSGVLTLSCTAAVVPALAGADALAVLVHACVPYFLGCIGCLVAARRAPAASALGVSGAWGALVALAALGAGLAVPAAYADAATGVWGLAALATLAGLAREAALLLRRAAEGLDAIAPAPAAR